MTTLVILLAALCLAPWVREALRHPVARLRRRDGKASLADLPQGATRYRWFGPEGGPVVVTIHGLTSPSEVFDPIALTLAQNGYRVLSYDLLGRGVSDDPKAPQDGAHFLQHLEDLLQEQGVTARLTLVGYSMGGLIASFFAARHPERVAALVFLAPAGMGLTLSTFWQVARDGTGPGRALALGLGDLELRRGMAASGPLRQAQRRQMRRRGYLPAVLSSLRGVLESSAEPALRQIARSKIPTLAIWAARDAVIPSSAAGQLARWHRAAEQEVLYDADHALPATHPEQVSDLIIQFFARHTP